MLIIRGSCISFGRAVVCVTYASAALGRPLLLIYSVVGSVPTEAWTDPQRDGMCGSPLRGGADCGGRALPTMYQVLMSVKKAIRN